MPSAVAGLRRVRRLAVVQHGLLPILFYLVSFSLLSYGRIATFFTRFWSDLGDGLQNAWDMWWVNQAILRPDLYPSIWQTPLLHWPYGTTLIGQTLNPFNGFLAVALLRVFSLTATYNAILVLGFVAGGVTAYWLAYYLCRSFWGSILGGFIFTFSSFHLAHAIGGHLQLVSLEWIPLFVLSWYRLITRPSVLSGTIAAIVLWLTLLCDYYYFFYCVLTAILVVIWYAGVNRSAWYILAKEYRLPVTAFVVLVLILAGPIVGHLVLSDYRDPLLGGHDPATYSLDLLAPFIPGGHWLFSQWTRFFWTRLPGNLAESSVHLALPVFLILGYLWMRRRSLEPEIRHTLYLWFTLMGGFAILALGPALHVAGTVVWDKAMPYTLLVSLLPFLQVSGLPVRMMVMVVLGGAVLSAIGFRELFRSFPRTEYVTFALLGLLLFETLPTPIPVTRLEVPRYVKVLAQLPDAGGVLDLAAPSPELLLYYQTIFRKPIVFGYISRTPTSVSRQDELLAKTIEDRDYRSLWNTYRIAYVVTQELIAAAPADICVLQMYNKNAVFIYKLQATCQ